MNQTAINRVRDKLRSYGKDGFPILSKRKREASFSFINERLSPEQRQKATGRTAAVLVPVARIGGEMSIIFTKRSETVGSHRGHVSFPGGHLEKDETNVQAAVREMKEEMGGSYDYDNDLSILGTAQSVPAITGIPVTPVIGALTEDINNVADVFEPNDDEVDFVFSRTIKSLLESETFEPLIRTEHAPAYPGKEGKIWGLTAIILSPLLHEILAPAFLEYCDNPNTAR